MEFHKNDGELEDCDVMANSPLPMGDVEGATGRVVIATVRREEGTYVRFVHLFRIQNCTLASELELPEDEWQESLKPAFAVGMIREMADAIPETSTTGDAAAAGSYYIVDHCEFVLVCDGSLLHSQSTTELESGHWYAEEKFVALLERWAPGS